MLYLNNITLAKQKTEKVVWNTIIVITIFLNLWSNIKWVENWYNNVHIDNDVIHIKLKIIYFSCGNKLMLITIITFKKPKNNSKLLLVLAKQSLLFTIVVS